MCLPSVVFPVYLSVWPSMLCLHFCTKSVWHRQRAGQGKCWRQRASRDNSYYNREAEDEHCIVLVMLSLDWDLGQHDLDLKQSYNQSLDSSLTTRQEILAVLFTGEECIKCWIKSRYMVTFLQLVLQKPTEANRALVISPRLQTGHWILGDEWDCEQQSASSSARALSRCHWDWHPCKS